MTIHISGSLAFDRIMNFPGNFADSILPEQLHIINISFLIDRLDIQQGGTAGNIAYTLSLLGERSRILATAGKDAQDYLVQLQAVDIDVSAVRVLDSEVTASCYLITDRNNNQINGFHPAAMNTSCNIDSSAFQRGDLAIISPGNLDDMRTLPRMYREANVRYIYDPGQLIPALSKENLLDAIAGSDFLISNDYELEMIARNTGRTTAELQELTGCLLTTLGEQGCRINGSAHTLIPAVPVTQVLDPTGAGDAFRAGFLKGLILDLPLEQAVRLACTTASYNVETSGTQTHSFTIAQLKARYMSTYEEPLPM